MEEFKSIIKVDQLIEQLKFLEHRMEKLDDRIYDCSKDISMIKEKLNKNDQYLKKLMIVPFIKIP